jgi:hypothetical protein
MAARLAKQRARRAATQVVGGRQAKKWALAEDGVGEKCNPLLAANQQSGGAA